MQKNIIFISATNWETVTFQNYLIKNFWQKNIVYIDEKNYIKEFYKGLTKLFFFNIGVGKKYIDKRILALIKFLDRMYNFEIINIGLAGAVAPKLKVGDVVIPGVIIDLSSSEKIILDDKNIDILATADKLVDKSQKIELYEHDKNISIVDMESFFIVKKFLEKNIKIKIVKCVLDEIDFIFPSAKFIRYCFVHSFLKFLYNICLAKIPLSNIGRCFMLYKRSNISRRLLTKYLMSRFVS